MPIECHSGEIMGRQFRERHWIQKMSYFYRSIRFWQSVMQNAKQGVNSVDEMREKYYQDLEKMHEQYDVFLHDMRHTMRTIASLAKQGDCKEIGQLINGLKVSLGDIEQKMICSHKILNALLAERKCYADENGVALELDITEPLYFQDIEDNDLLALIGNLLDNAIEAEMHSIKKEGILCSICPSAEGRYMLIQIENSYTHKRSDGQTDKSLKAGIGEKHGIGLHSVRRIIRKYGGLMDNSKSNGRYLVKVILPIQDMQCENAAIKHKKSIDADAL